MVVNYPKHNLTPKEKRILLRRYGLDGPAATLQELSDELGLSRATIQSIHRRAEQKLREFLNYKP